MLKERCNYLENANIFIDGIIDKDIKKIMKGLFEKVNFSSFLDLFRNRIDPFAAGEIWGKLVRAVSYMYLYSRELSLKKLLEDTLEDAISIQKINGDLSTVAKDKQPQGNSSSDIWERKYILIGLLNIYKALKDERALDCAEKEVNYLSQQIGSFPKTSITETGWAFYGIESSSILQPLMEIYKLTGNQNCLQLANHIVIETGACKRENIFEAIEKGKNPKDIGWNGVPEESIAKAYEMMSCFEGLIDYYEVTEDPRWLSIAQKFTNKVIEQEITILGSGGGDKPYNFGPGTGEQWNFTAYEQANPDISLMMETCVTVYFIKLCEKLYKITSDIRLIEKMERSTLNVLLGALKKDGASFEYFSKFNGLRGSKVNFSYEFNGFSISCCTANGPTGLAMIPFDTYMEKDNGIAVNYFWNSECKCEINGAKVTISQQTKYPKIGEVALKINSDEEVNIFIRIPEFAVKPEIFINGNCFNAVAGKYFSVSKKFEDEEIVLKFQIPIEIIYAPKSKNESEQKLVAFKYGNIILSRDKRFDENFDKPISLDKFTYSLLNDIDCNFVAVKICMDGEYLTLVDYSTAGNTWDDASEFRTWISVNN